jgi:hypothetical protein
MAYQYDKPTLDLFTRIKRAADPKNIANPLKLIPLAYAEKARPQQPLSAAAQQLADAIRTRRDARVPCTVTGANTRLKTAAEHPLSRGPLTKFWILIKPITPLPPGPA